jgi:opacity protein-like surface antigen
MAMNTPKFSETGYVFGAGPDPFTSIPPGFTFGNAPVQGPLTTQIGDVMMGTLGIGAYITRHLRGDITFDFRDYPGFNATTNYSYQASTGGALNGNTINGTLRESFRTRGVVTMVNGYFDILPRGLFTPYVGGGIGFVYNDIQRYRSNQELSVTPASVVNGVQTFTNGGKESNNIGLAAALMGGVSFAFDQRWVLDVNYRAQYLAGGSVDLNVVNGAAVQLTKGTVGDHWEHQVRVGLRLNIW